MDKRAKDGVRYPSGSSIGYLGNCVGRHQAQRNFPDNEDSDANLGTEIHWHLSEETPEDELPEEVEFAVMRAREMTDSLRKEFAINGQVHRENRIWLYEDGEPMFSGEIDFYEISKNQKTASIIDYKTLYGFHPPADKNRQLQIYAVLLGEEYCSLEAVKLGLVQPMLGLVTTAIIRKPAIQNLRKNLVALVGRAMGENPSRRGGVDQCKWCRALAHCPEAYEFINENLKRLDDEMEAVDNKKLSEKMALSPLLEKFSKSVKSLVRDRLEKGIDVPDFGLRSTGKITTYDPVKAAKILFDANLSVDEFLACCSVKEPQLIKAWQKHTGLPPKKAKDNLRLRLENALRQKEKSKSVSKK